MATAEGYTTDPTGYGTVDSDEQGSVTDLEEKKRAVIAGLRDYMHFAFNKVGAHSKEEAEPTLSTIKQLEEVELTELSSAQLGKQRTEIENNLQWMQMEGGMKSQREKISNAWDKLNESVKEAVISGAISEESAERWIKRFQDAKVGAGTKIEFVNLQLPILLTKAEKLADERKELLKHKQLKNITPSMVKDVKIFLDEKKFLALHYLERENLKASMAGALEGAEQFPTLYERTKGMLEAAVASGAMSKNKVGKWLESLFAQERSPFEINKILKGELKEYIGAWTRVRLSFDIITGEMQKHGIPQGFDLLSADEFLELDFPQRESYVEEAERSLKVNLNGISDAPIDQLKLQIRHELQVKDWESAEGLIAKAWEIAEGEDIDELHSMENYLKEFRKGNEESGAPEESITQTLHSMREALAEAPESVRMLYLGAMQRGYNTLSSLTTQMYNLVWCHNNGYLDGSKEVALHDASIKDTKKIIENGHEKRGLENINLDTVGGDEKSEAMRPYKNTWAPTLYHMDCSDGGSRARYLDELQGKNATRDYWSTLKLVNIPYETQRYLVYNTSRKLKSGMRKLKEAGVPFTLSGPATTEQSDFSSERLAA